MDKNNIGPRDLVFRADAIRAGRTDSELNREVHAGSSQRVWHGAYLPVAGDESTLSYAAKLERYRATVIAASLNGGPNRTASHFSAAAMHRIPMLNPDFSMVHFTSTTTGKHIKRGIIHQAALRESDIVVVDDTQVTSLARSVCDVARMGTLVQAVCVLDSGLHLGVTTAELDTQLKLLSRRRGIAMLRSALVLANGLSESVGETVSRVGLADCPLIPVPELQVEIEVELGGRRQTVRGDFGWRDRSGRLRVVGEFDGRFKYHRTKPFADDRLPEDVIYDEKLREDAIRATGPQVVRWTWSDARRPKVLHPRVIAALRAAGIVQ
ncbi:hypothetical protein ACIGKQ_11585 [Gordonia sp. NPDC062954]|jgi:hypothetical protein|uniref:hypothetical protein n=1 Tax=Gordonia sp. NPDC062954 TaxID=3364003 RepID=UPI0037CB8D87